MGLAPMHTWLPDAHSEAPSPVSALLSGALLNGAFLAILRAAGIMNAAGLGDFVGELLRLFGLFSIALAGAFILGQKDFKRLLAYSSVEHMGILAFAAGLGGNGLWAALLHAANHTAAKGCLFLTAGNIYYRYHSKSVLAVSGLRRAMPLSGPLWLAGFLAICALPPFGMFYPEFATLKTAFADGRDIEAALFLVFLAVVFVGMLKTVLAMLRGPDSQALAADGGEGEGDGEGDSAGDRREADADSLWMALPPLILVLCALLLGFGLPDVLARILAGATAAIEPGFAGMPGVTP